MGDFKSKADVLYEDVVNYQENIESIMSMEGAKPSDIVEAIGFQKDTLKDEIIKCYKTRENYMTMAEAANEEAKIIAERAKAIKARASEFEQKALVIDEVIKAAMMAMNEERIFSPLVTIEVKPGNQVVEIDDPDAVPDELRNKPKVPEPSKTLLKAYLQEHPDCTFAHFERPIDVKYKVD